MTSKKANVDFCLKEFSAMKIVTWKCHADKYAKGSQNTTLGKYHIIEMGMYLKFYHRLIIGDGGSFEGSLKTMVKTRNYYFTSLTDKIDKL